MDEEPSTDTHGSPALAMDGCEGRRSTDLLAGRELFTRVLIGQGRALLRLAFRITGHPQDAEEVVQNAFLYAVMATPRTFNDPRHVECWFVKVVKDRAFDLLRKRAALLALGEPDAGESASRAIGSEPPPDGRVEFSEFFAGFQALPRCDQELLWQVDVLEHTNAEMARMLGVRVGTVASRLRAARHKLRAALELTRAL